jgi:hypothetical protein
MLLDLAIAYGVDISNVLHEVRRVPKRARILSSTRQATLDQAPERPADAKENASVERVKPSPIDRIRAKRLDAHIENTGRRSSRMVRGRANRSVA